MITYLADHESAAGLMQGLMQSGGGMATQLVLLALAIGGLTVVMISTRKKMVKRAKDQASRPSERESIARRQEEIKRRRDLDQVMLELDQLSRQIHARIDTKFAKLEAVIRDADKRIDLLKKLTQEADERGIDVDSQAGVGAGRVTASKSASRLDITLEQQTPTPSSNPDQVERLHEHADIYALEDEGHSPQEIASKVGKNTGEVQLILSLRKAHENA